ncbi:MAG: hypothetical protein C9356_20255 [Oleiphilus sp.]|nr:MAG: hypothetical protein C9356_20255 [Oleiphilus sp.]
MPPGLDAAGVLIGHALFPLRHATISAIEIATPQIAPKVPTKAYMMVITSTDTPSTVTMLMRRCSRLQLVFRHIDVVASARLTFVGWSFAGTKKSNK